MMDATKGDNIGKTRPSGSFGSKISSRSSEHSIAKLMETLEAATSVSSGTASENQTDNKDKSQEEVDTVKQLGQTCQGLQVLSNLHHSVICQYLNMHNFRIKLNNFKTVWTEWWDSWVQWTATWRWSTTNRELGTLLDQPRPPKTTPFNSMQVQDRFLLPCSLAMSIHLNSNSSKNNKSSISFKVLILWRQHQRIKHNPFT